MSKVAFTIALPHDKVDGNRTPGFFLSTSNNTYLSFKGGDFRGARWGNSNATSGWKNRFEYSVTAAKGITKFSLIMNTSVILPPLSWALPTGDDAKKTPEKRKKAQSRSSSNSNSSHSSRSSKHSKSAKGDRDDSRGSSRRSDHERDQPQPRLKEPSSPVRRIEDGDRQHRRERRSDDPRSEHTETKRERRERRRRTPRDPDPGFVGYVPSGGWD